VGCVAVLADFRVKCHMLRRNGPSAAGLVNECGMRWAASHRLVSV